MSVMPHTDGLHPLGTDGHLPRPVLAVALLLPPGGIPLARPGATDARWRT